MHPLLQLLLALHSSVSLGVISLYCAICYLKVNFFLSLGSFRIATTYSVLGWNIHSSDISLDNTPPLHLSLEHSWISSHYLLNPAGLIIHAPRYIESSHGNLIHTCPFLCPNKNRNLIYWQMILSGPKYWHHLTNSASSVAQEHNYCILTRLYS